MDESFDDFLTSTVSVDRKAQTGTSPTNEPIFGTLNVHTALPCEIESIDIAGDKSGNLTYTIYDVQYQATHVLLVDGLSASDVSGHVAGDVIAQDGVNYTVSANLHGAFPDLAAYDRVTDEAGVTYLILSVIRYYDILPHLEVRLVRGQAW